MLTFGTAREREAPLCGASGEAVGFWLKLANARELTPRRH